MKDRFCICVLSSFEAGKMLKTLPLCPETPDCSYAYLFKGVGVLFKEKGLYETVKWEKGIKQITGMAKRT